jgi:hypothetical protein
MSCNLRLVNNTSKINFSLSNFFKNGINPDEYHIANIAYSYNKGLGFRANLSYLIVKPIAYENNEQLTFRKDVIKIDSSYYAKTSYRPFIPVLLHVYYQRMYNKLIAPLKDSDIYYTNKNHISNYYILYGQFLIWLAFFLTLISIPFLHKIIEAINLNNKKFISNAILIPYILFPSSLFYIGAIPMYENITVPCLVIIISLLIQFLQDKRPKYGAFIISLLTGVVISIRPQSYIPLFIIFSYFLYQLVIKMYHYKKINKSMLQVLIYTFIVVIINVGHTIYINYSLWNKLVFSTRGDALLWGHNPLARGSWDSTFDIPGSPGFEYQKKNIPELFNLNEYETSKAKASLAVKNIFLYPKHEIELIFKKLAIFFLPYNFLDYHFSFILFFVYSGFILYILYFILNFKNEILNYSRTICLIWVIGVITVNIIFFVEYRIRYFAEPFMLILSMWIYDKLWSLIKLCKLKITIVQNIFQK